MARIDFNGNLVLDAGESQKYITTGISYSSIDYTSGYAENDPLSDLTVVASTITTSTSYSLSYTGAQNVVKSYGSGYFTGDLYFKFSFKLGSGSSGTGYMVPFALHNSATNLRADQWWNVSNGNVAVYIPATSRALVLRSYDTSQHISSSYTVSYGTTYYCDVYRITSDGKWYLDIYSDSDRTSLLASRELTYTTANDYDVHEGFTYYRLSGNLNTCTSGDFEIGTAGGTTTISTISNDTTLANASPSAFVTEYAIKTYVDDNAGGGFSFDGSNNVFSVIGPSAMGGTDNLVYGQEAGETLTGINNVILGDQAGKTLSTGNRNVFIGEQCGSFIASGGTSTASDNIAIGYSSLREAYNDSNYNVAIGYSTMFNTSRGSIQNIALGRDAMYYGYNANDDNIAIGYQAMYGPVTGYSEVEDNIAIGYRALYSIQSPVGGFLSTDNIAIGASALLDLTNGSSNIAIGAGAGSSIINGIGSVCVGQNSGASTNTPIVAIGSSAGNSSTGLGNTFVGYQAGAFVEAGIQNIVVGYTAGRGAFDDNNDYNRCTIIGLAAGTNLRNAGDDNIAIGYNTMFYETSGSRNTAVGNFALGGVSGGDHLADYNTCVGYGAGYYLDSGEFNIFIGYQAGSGQVSLAGSDGTHNILIGYNSLRRFYSNDYNICIGSETMQSDAASAATVNNNIMIGYRAGYVAGSANNVMIGHQAGDTIIEGGSNTFIGYQADADSSSHSNAAAYGNGAVATASNYIAMGNTSVSAAEAQVSWGTYSDKRMKSNIINNDIGLDFIVKLQPKRFNKIDIGEHKMYDGLIAQEVKTAMDELGIDFSGWRKNHGESGMQTLAYSDFVMPLINAVKELKKEVDELKKRL